MAVDVVPPSAPENKATAAVRGIPSFYQAVMAEMPTMSHFKSKSTVSM